MFFIIVFSFFLLCFSLSHILSGNFLGTIVTGCDRVVVKGEVFSDFTIQQTITEIVIRRSVSPCSTVVDQSVSPCSTVVVQSVSSCSTVVVQSGGPVGESMFHGGPAAARCTFRINSFARGPAMSFPRICRIRATT